MLTAFGTFNNEKTLILGLTQENLRRLAAGEPIHHGAKAMPGMPLGFFIFVDEDMETLFDKVIEGTHTVPEELQVKIREMLARYGPHEDLDHKENVRKR